jgi:hypothetical protein
MDACGREYAGKEVAAAGFLAAVGRRTEKDVAGFVRRWEAKPGVGGPAFGVLAFLDAPEETLIVYGTAADAAANRDAAVELQRLIRERWSNFAVPVKPDADVTDADWKGKHVVLIGRPATNAAARRTADGLPVRFGPSSCAVNGDVYAHERTAVVAARANPFDPRFAAVVVGGLSADATYRAVGELMKYRRPTEVLVLPADGKAKPVLAAGPAAAVGAAGR